MTPHFTYDDCVRYVAVSRETFDRLQAYVLLLEKWQSRINLIGTATQETVWMRHLIDSIQLIPLLSAPEPLLDVGSGAGFPGLVLAIAGVQHVTLIESDTRKCSFLREAARITQTQVAIRNERIEESDAVKSHFIITARAFAPLQGLLQLLANGLTHTHRLLLLKGKNWKQEIGSAYRDWSFDYDVRPSITHEDGVILSLFHLRKQGARL